MMDSNPCPLRQLSSVRIEVTIKANWEMVFELFVRCLTSVEGFYFLK